MKLLIFKIKLLGHLSLFLLNLVFNQAKRVKLFFITIFIFFIIANLVFFYFFKNKIDKKDVLEKQTYSPARPELYVKSTKTKSEIQDEISYWEKIIEKQPQSRDALINLSILKNIINQTDEAEKLWNKTKLIDPNNPVFQN